MILKIEILHRSLLCASVSCVIIHKNSKGTFMPKYVYEIILPDGKSGPSFEIEQKINDPVLKKHPDTGEPVRRVFLAPYIPHNKFDKLHKHYDRQDALTREKETESREKAKENRQK